MTDQFQPLPSAIEIAATDSTSDATSPLASVEGTDWHQVFDILDPFIAKRDELAELHETAPNRRAQDWIVGLMDIRAMDPIDIPSHPLANVAGTEWHLALRALNIIDASRAELEELERTAPSRRAQDWLAGILDTRKMYSIVTGIAF
jgi:hypothetical protein